MLSPHIDHRTVSALLVLISSAIILAILASGGFTAPALAQAGVASPLAQRAESRMLAPVQDAWIWQNEANNNFGACDLIYIDTTRSNLGNGRMLLRFDLSALPTGATITSARLYLSKIGGDNDTHHVEARALSAAWEEGNGDCAGAHGAAVNWRERKEGVPWDATGGDFSGAIDSASVGSAGEYHWDIGALAQAWLDDPAANFGLLLASFDTGTETYAFASREHADANSRPRLSVEYTVPSPAIAGRVWEDVNRDGIVGGDEPRLAGVSVSLLAGACGTAQISPPQSAITGAGGEYEFGGLDEGPYCVQVDESTLPSDFLLTTAANPQDVDASTLGTHYADFGYASAYAEDRLAVSTYSPCPDIAWLQAIAANHGGAVTQADHSACTFLVEAPAATMAALRQEVAAEQQSRDAAPDVRTRGSYTPNDPHYNNPSLVYGPQQINAPAAWDLTTGDSSLIVAVIDSGIDPAHPEFSGRLLPGWDFANDDPDPFDDNGHGTHVAGIIAAGFDNGIGIAGMAGGVQILPVKVLDASGNGWWSDVAAGVTWAVNYGAHVLNLSLTGSVDSVSLRDAIAYATSKGVVVVVAAGNSSSNVPMYPASYENVFSLGATTFDTTRWSLSNYGPNVDAMAPGATVYSTRPGKLYGFMSGTSMASPHAAGLAALMLSRNPNLTPAEVKTILQDTASDMGDPGPDELYGYGRIDAGAAVAAVPPAAYKPPLSSLSAELAADLNHNGLLDPGDSLRYRILAANTNPAPLDNVSVRGVIPAYSNYMAGSTKLNGIPVLDDGAPDSAFPLDGAGLNIGSVPANNSSAVTFEVRVGQPPRGVYALLDTATVASDLGSEDLVLESEVAGTLLRAEVDKSDALAGENLVYALKSDYLRPELLAGVTVTAPLPTGTSYVPGSANAGGSEGGGVVTWNLGSNAAGIPGAGPGAYRCQATTSFFAVADTYIEQDDQAANNGGSNEAWTRGESNKTKRALYRFDLSTLPPGAQIKSADLNLYVRSTRDDHDARIRRVTTAWSETANWNTPWAAAGGDFEGTIYGLIDPSLGGYQQASITALVQGWADGAFANHGLLLDPLYLAGGTGDAKYATREQAGQQPYITATYEYLDPLGCWQTLQAPLLQDATVQAGGTFENNNDLKTKGSGDLEEALIQFDLSGIPAGAFIDDATFTLNVSSAQADASDSIHRLLSPWTESGGSWGVAKPAAGVDYVAAAEGSIQPTATGALSADISTLVDAWVNGGAANHGFMLLRQAGINEVKYVSSEGGGATLGPRLLVRYRSPQVSLFLEDVADTYIDEANPDSNYEGVRLRLRPDAGSRNHSLIRFDLSPVPAGATVVEAVLGVTAQRNIAGVSATVQRMLTPWSEESATWNDADGSGAGDWVASVFGAGDYDPTVYGSLAPASAGVLYTTPVTTLARAWIEQGQANEGLILLANGTATDRQELYTRSDAGFEPWLALQYITPHLYTGSVLAAEPTLASAGNAITITMTLTQTGMAGTGGSQDVRIAGGADDAEQVGPDGACQGGPGSIYLISTDLEITEDVEPISCGTQILGLRFNGLNVPHGSTITSASITFHAIAPDSPNTNDAATSLTIAGQAADNPPTFTTAPDNVSARPRTTATAAWSPPPWTSGVDYSTPDLAAIVQEIVDRPGWASGNSMAFIISGSGSRSADSYDGNAATAPLLHIEWAEPPAPAIPAPLTITGTNGVTASLIGGPTPAPASVAGGSATITWAYQVAASGQIGQLIFGGEAASGSVTWPWAQSNSVIVHPPLSFAATIDDPPAGPLVQATAFIADAGDLLPSHASNTPITRLPASIGDRVWSDGDGDAIQDPAEPGIAGITVILTDGGGATSTTSTGAGGGFDFTNLAAGVYTLTIDPASVPPEYDLITTRHPLVVTVADGDDLNSADFGFKARSISLGDSIWYDADGDGAQDAGEPGLGNVTLDLWLDDGDGVFEPASALGSDTFIGSTVSNASGSYRLDAPQPGAYFIDVSDDYGILGGLAHTIGVHSISDPSPPISVNIGTIYQDADFGYVKVPSSGTGLAGDLVWIDENGDGVRQMAEAAAIGVEICAVPAGGGPAVACATSDLNGRYCMELPPGDYELAATNPPIGLNLSTGGTVAIAVVEGQSTLVADFGYAAGSTPLGSIGGQIWQDLPVGEDYDGIFDPLNEPGIPNVSTDLILDLNGDGGWDGGEPYVATISDLGGIYEFGGLLPGRYLVRVSDVLQTLRNFAPTVAPLGASSPTDGSNKPQPYAVDLAAGETNTLADFGYREYETFGAGDPPQPGTIGDLLWFDQDGDGLYEPQASDQPLAGVTVLLRSLDGGPDRSATTGLDGRYLFTDLPLGAYEVEVTDLFGVLATYMPTITGFDSQNQPYTANLGLSTGDMGADFGYTQAASVGGFLYFDMNGDGMRDGSENTGVHGIAITLTHVSSGATMLALSDSGGYSFANVTPGLYRLSAPPSAPGLARTSASPLEVMLLAGEIRGDVDFGFISPTAVTLASFTAVSEGSGIILQWSTRAEEAQAGFVVWRAALAEGPYKPVSGLIPAANDPAGASYKWFDQSVAGDGLYWYKLESVAQAGGAQIGGEFFGPIPSRDDPGDASQRLFTPLVLR